MAFVMSDQTSYKLYVKDKKIQMYYPKGLSSWFFMFPPLFVSKYSLGGKKKKKQHKQTNKNKQTIG